MGRTKEIWKPVRNWEHKYEISNKGRLRNIETQLILKPLSVGCKYYYFMFYDPKRKSKNKRVKVYLHRMLAQCFIPNPYLHNEVNHKDGDKWNCSLDNLEWVSKSENSKHAVATGLHRPYFMDGNTKGEGNVNAKLNWDKVHDIRKRYAEGESLTEMAEEYGVAVGTLEFVVKNKSWKEE